MLSVVNLLIGCYVIDFIMTTKEFIRRSDYFSKFDSACISISDKYYCWKITKIYNGNSSVFFTADVSNFFNEFPAVLVYCDDLYLEKYSRSLFDIELRYFRSFLSRLSNYQMESLKASGKCSHLLAFVFHNNNSNV